MQLMVTTLFLTVLRDAVEFTAHLGPFQYRNKSHRNQFTGSKDIYKQKGIKNVKWSRKASFHLVK